MNEIDQATLRICHQMLDLQIEAARRMLALWDCDGKEIDTISIRWGENIAASYLQLKEAVQTASTLCKEAIQ